MRRAICIMERLDIKVGPIRVEVVEPLQKLRVVVEDNDHGISADLTIAGRHFPIEEPRTVRRNGPRIVQDVTRMTQLGRWSGRLRAGGREISLDEATTVGTRDRSWGVRQVGMRDPQPPATPQEFQVWWYWLPAHFEDRIVHFYINEDGAGRPWNAALIVVHDNGTIEHLERARLAVDFTPGTRFPCGGVITAQDENGGTYRIEVGAGPRFFMTGLGYMNPDWTHGLNKGPLAVGYDEIVTSGVVKHEAPYQHVQAFAPLGMTLPDGRVLGGHGCFKSLVMGRHEPSGLTSMFDVP